ncbi:hypothetical protein PORY_002836 [Pneumocystis oryctolagi]|uniref:Uncharacterized protein n=1 Tax=Pneumocystis oryctolagi TaxID=42067 RepID=A0ACB7CA00_9ASCO|nr:hypothetical protein PORY_002836 [Pneumocystis oryctolagi]
MTLEATMIVMDNSEFARNGDYLPTRLGSQKDAINLIFSSKLRAHPENLVGLMSMGGESLSPEILVTLTQDYGKFLAAMHESKIGGCSHICTGIQVAHLALKHRPEKRQRQRIIVFVGSPVLDDEKTLVKLAKKMKKNNVAVDFINFGEIYEENTSKLTAFIEAINSDDNSHLTTIPPGPHLLSDQLLHSPVITNDQSSIHGASNIQEGLSGEHFDFGVDPNLDPELALALQMSLQEEQARQEVAEEGKAHGNRVNPSDSSSQDKKQENSEKMDIEK